MAVYSIKDLEKLTGIKAHTIRIWEVRYGLITPGRTPTKIRFYTDNELRVLFNIALLNKHGYKISKIAQLSTEQISEKVALLADNNIENETQLDALTLAMIDMDEAKFDHTIRQNVEELGFERTMLHVLYPFLDKLNLLWLTGSVSPAHENFIGNLIRQKIIAAIDHLPAVSGREVKTFLLFLPEGETQELSLLFMHYLVKNRGQRAIYLGQHATLADLREAVGLLKPDFVFTIINEPLPRQPLQNWLDQLQSQVVGTHFLLTGQQFFVQTVRLPGGSTLFNSLGETVDFLENL